MIYTVSFKGEHVFKLDLQPAQEWFREFLTPENMKGLENEWAVTVMEDGNPLLCVGPMVYWQNRALIWTFVSRGLRGRKFLMIHLMARRYLDGLPFRRLEATVECDFTAGHRWVKALGFELEAPRMRAFQVDGQDSALYARVKK